MNWLRRLWAAWHRPSVWLTYDRWQDSAVQQQEER